MKKVLIIVLIVIILVASGILVYKYYNQPIKEYLQKLNGQVAEENTINEEENIVIETPEEPEKEVQIYNGTDRVIAVMIDNDKKAWPQAGLNEAFLVYEIVIEGIETRLMACFKGVNLEMIGPIRSARPYFLDYALENSAIYVHHGWSTQAEADIPILKVNNINGISESSKSFWRQKGKYAPHNIVTTTDKILTIAERKGYSTESEAPSVLNYVTDEVELADGDVANKVTIPYNSKRKVEYFYDEETKMYTRYSRETKQTDWNSGEDITTKNIIITKAKNYTLNDPEKKGRQGLENIGVLDGYYITNGKVIPITCTKTSRISQTVYADLEGNEIEVNDGRTFIQICPINTEITFE